MTEKPYIYFDNILQHIHFYLYKIFVIINHFILSPKSGLCTLKQLMPKGDKIDLFCLFIY